MIWNDSRIAEWAASGGVTPFDETLVNPASLDLRIGNQIREPHEMWRRFSDIDIQHHIDNGTIDDLPKWGEPKTFDTFWLFPKRFVLCHSLEFVQIPLDVACILVLKSSWGRKGLNHSHCLAGDTLIDIPRDLSVNPNGIPISDLSEKQFHVYAFDTNSMKFVLAPAFAFPAKQNTDVVKVEYEWMTGGKWKRSCITCTPDHRFLTLDGRWVEAQNLLGERLMPMWRGSDGRYGWISDNPLNRKTIREHRFIGEFLYSVDSSMEIHHINENKLDNRFENLIPIPPGLHQSFHSKGEKNPFYGKTHTDEVRSRLSLSRTGKKLSESHRKNMSLATSGEKNPRYVEISLGQIVSAYRQTGNMRNAANELGIHECTLLEKIKANGFSGAVDFRKQVEQMQNHKVISVSHLTERQDTFDIHVPGYENFVANGVVVHNSGWGDPGFGLKADVVGSNDTQQCGAQWTFEIQNISPWAIKITAGDRLIQQVFMDMCDVPLVDYRSTGHYVYQAGATPART